jgi:DNA-binding CsgD family transcriptional regulator
MSSSTSIESFLDELYLAAGEPNRWDGVMGALMQLFDTDKSHLAIHDNRTGVVRKSSFFGWEQGHIDQGVAHYFQKDPWVLAMQAKLAVDPGLINANLLLHGSELVPFKEFSETECYRDFGRHAGIDDCIFIGGMADQNHRFGLVVNTGDGRLFGERDIGIARQIANHIPRAMRLHSRISMSAGARHLDHFWERSLVAILVVHNGRLGYLNGSARTLVTEGSVVGVQRGRVTFGDPAVQSGFDLMTSRSGVGEPSGARSLNFQIMLENASRWLVQMIRMNPVEGSLLSLTGLAAPSVMVAITPLTAHAAARQGAIAGFVQLTDAEREVLMLLVQGSSVEQIADSTGRKISTIRWYVRCLIEKLDASSISDVVRIGSLLLPV